MSSRRVSDDRITVETLKKNAEIETYIKKSNETLAAIGYTEHGLRHVTLVSNIAYNVLRHLGHPEREAELAAIAGYIHDIGNVAGRYQHGLSSALLAFQILRGLGLPPEELAVVMAAVGNHEEEYGEAVHPVAAAIILADKSDVHFTRVQNHDPATFDIHDRVNFAVKHSFLRVEEKEKEIVLELTIDPTTTAVMDYFEIFLSRMVMCRRAAEFLGSSFKLSINGNRLA